HFRSFMRQHQRNGLSHCDSLSPEGHLAPTISQLASSSCRFTKWKRPFSATTPESSSPIWGHFKKSRSSPTRSTTLKRPRFSRPARRGGRRSSRWESLASSRRRVSSTELRAQRFSRQPPQRADSHASFLF